MSLCIYVVYNAYDNINIFFTDLNKAQQKIKELKESSDVEFKIRVLKEGEFFEADMNFH